MKAGHDNRNWFIRYKLYHLPFWLVYNFFSWSVVVGNPVKAGHDLLYPPFTVKCGFYVLFQTLAVCFNLYFLFPRYLAKNKLVPYTVLTLLTTVGAAFLIIPGYYTSAAMAHVTIQRFWGKDACIFQFFSNAFLSTLAAMT